MIRVLQTKGMFQSLAEPNLVAESGKEASFLAGGEVPIPIAQGTGGNVAISVQYKEFGIRLNFTPVVNGDRIHLKVRPEVSSLDFNNAVVLQGFRIPALSTRRTETELELRNGQTFAIAGLLNSTVMESLEKVPGLGDIPILGLLFRSKAAQKQRTELVVMITPEILPNNSPGVTPDLPRMPQPFLPPYPENQSQPMPGPAFESRPSGSASAQPMITPDATRPAPAASAASAAAAVSALAPSSPKIIMPTATSAADQPTASPDSAVVPPEPEVAPAAEPALSPAPVAASDSTPVTPEEFGASTSLEPLPSSASAGPASFIRPLTPEELERIEKARQEEAAARGR